MSSVSWPPLIRDNNPPAAEAKSFARIEPLPVDQEIGFEACLGIVIGAIMGYAWALLT